MDERNEKPGHVFDVGQYRRTKRRYDRHAAIMTRYLQSGHLFVEIYERMEFTRFKYPPGSVATIYRNRSQQMVIDVHEPI